MTLEFPFASRNPPQTIPTGQPSTPHEPKLERHRASAGLREAFYRGRPGGGDVPATPRSTLCDTQPPGPWPAETIFYCIFYYFSINYYKLPLRFLVDPHAGALGPLGVGGFKGLRPLPPTPRKKSRSRLSGVSNESRRPFANSAKKKNMFTWRCVKTPRNPVSADGPITTLKSKRSWRC